jgi:methionyl-tRNA synthetase
MSKSVGNVVDPNALLEKYSADSLRFYIASQAAYGTDMRFSPDALETGHNSELADIVGNLVHRAVTITQRMAGGVVPDVKADVVFDLDALRAESEAAMGSLKIEVACEVAMRMARETNKYMTEKEPWNIKGDGKEAKQQVVVRTVLESIYTTAHFLSPYIPTATSGVFHKLGTPPTAIKDLSAGFDNLQPGTPVTVGAILFKKVGQEEATAGGGPKKAKLTVEQQKAEKKKKQEAKFAGNTKKPGSDSAISKLEFVVGQITKVWEHPEAEKLYCEQIDVGADEPRLILSGLRSHYPIEALENRKVVVLMNLKPKKMLGMESHGMVLCGEDPGTLKTEFVDPPAGAKVGERVSFEGCEGEPIPAAQVDRKKVLKTIQENKEMASTADKVAAWKGIPFMTSAGPCTLATLAGAVLK